MAAATGAGWDKAASDYSGFETFTSGFARDAIDLAIAECPLAQATGPIRVLDVAAGTGAATLRAIEALCERDASREVHVLATDISENMLAQLKERAEGLREKYPNVTVEVRVADMQNLEGFGTSSFDFLTCVFGVMFPPDPVAALREMRRVLRPEGAGAVVTWHFINMEEALAPLAVRQGFVEKEEDFSFGLEAFGQVRSMRRLLAKAGFVLGTALGSREKQGLGEACCRFVTRPPTMRPLRSALSALTSNPVCLKLGNWDVEAAYADFKERCAACEPGHEDDFAMQGTALVSLVRGGAEG